MSKAQVFRTVVIKPVLVEFGGINLAAEEILLGTAVQESLNFMYRSQVGGGPAKGVFQMEPLTHDDIWSNYLKYRKKLAEKAISFLTSPNVDKIVELENNDKYAAAMARIHYMRVSAPLPKAGDIVAQARYWKQYYNTPLGKGLPHEYIDKWQKYVIGGRP